MATKANYFKIGVFVIGAAVILIAGVIVLSAGLLTRESLMFETYIDESVQGLSIGSSVFHRGVQLGTVRQITFLPMGYPKEMKYGSDAYRQYSRYVLVKMAIDRSNFPQMAGDDTISDIVNTWVKNGLRLKLTYQGITGISFIEADYVDSQRYPEDELELTWEPTNIYIPAAPSMFKSFVDSIDSILQALGTIDFGEISTTLTATLENFDKSMTDADIPQLREELVGLLGDLRITNQLVIGMMDKSKSEDGVNIPETLAQFDSTLKRLDKFLSIQQSEIQGIFSNIRLTTENLREFTENLKKYPGSIIGGPPLPPEELK